MDAAASPTGVTVFITLLVIGAVLAAVGTATVVGAAATTVGCLRESHGTVGVAVRCLVPGRGGMVSRPSYDNDKQQQHQAP